MPENVKKLNTFKRRAMTRRSAKISPETVEFCQNVREFCDRYGLTTRKFAEICGTFQKSTAHRLFLADPSLFEDFVNDIRPSIAQAFVIYLEDAGYSAAEIEAELSPMFEIQEFKSMLANRCELFPEAVRFFGLKSDPFDVNKFPAPEEIFTNPELDNVVKRLRDAVLHQQFVACIGAVGAGKTLVKLRLAHELLQLEQKVQLIYPEFFNMEELSVAGIALQILAELDQPIPQQKVQRVTKIKKVLTSFQEDNVKVALVMDECHRLPDRVISSLKNFWEMNNGLFSRLLGVVLFGQPSFVDARLRDVKFKEIRQRVQIIEMPDMSRSGVDYVAHRLGLVGGNLEELFEPDAISRICQNASTPLALGNLVNEALTEAFYLEERKVELGMEYFKKLRSDRNILSIRRRAA